MSQDEIAEKLAVKRSSYAEWEKETIPRADIFFRFSIIVGYRAEDLLTEGWQPAENSSESSMESRAYEQPEREPTMKEILKIIADGYKAQVETIKSIESKMAQQADQLAIKEKVQDMETRTNDIDANLKDVRQDVTTLLERQESAIEEFRDQFLILKGRKSAPSKGARKKHDHNG